MNSRIATIIVPLVLLLLIGWFIWPTIYYYDRVDIGDNSLPVRVSRLSGRVEIMSLSSGWRAVKGNQKTDKKVESLPKSELNKLKSEGGSWGGDIVQLNIYNGSQYSVTQITIMFDVFEKRHGLSTILRRYSVDRPDYKSFVKPLSSSQYSFNIYETLGSTRAWNYNIIGAKGFLSEK